MLEIITGHFFLRKNPDWANETEFRWLVRNQNAEIEDVSIVESIKAVLVGMDFPNVYKPSLIALCEELKITAKRIIWHNGLPKAEPEIIYTP